MGVQSRFLSRPYWFLSYFGTHLRILVCLYMSTISYLSRLDMSSDSSSILFISAVVEVLIGLLSPLSLISFRIDEFRTVGSILLICTVSVGIVKYCNLLLIYFNKFCELLCLSDASPPSQKVERLNLFVLLHSSWGNPWGPGIRKELSLLSQVVSKLLATLWYSLLLPNLIDTVQVMT